MANINTNEIFATTTPPKEDLVLSSGTWNLQEAVGGSYKLFFEIPSDLDKLAEMDAFETSLYQ